MEWVLKSELLNKVNSHEMFFMLMGLSLLVLAGSMMWVFTFYPMKKREKLLPKLAVGFSLACFLALFSYVQIEHIKKFKSKILDFKIVNKKIKDNKTYVKIKTSIDTNNYNLKFNAKDIKMINDSNKSFNPISIYKGKKVLTDEKFLENINSEVVLNETKEHNIILVFNKKNNRSFKLKFEKNIEEIKDYFIL